MSENNYENHDYINTKVIAKILKPSGEFIYQEKPSILLKAETRFNSLENKTEIHFTIPDRESFVVLCFHLTNSFKPYYQEKFDQWVKIPVAEMTNLDKGMGRTTLTIKEYKSDIS